MTLGTGLGVMRPGAKGRRWPRGAEEGMRPVLPGPTEETQPCSHLTAAREPIQDSGGVWSCCFPPPGSGPSLPLPPTSLCRAPPTPQAPCTQTPFTQARGGCVNPPVPVLGTLAGPVPGSAPRSWAWCSTRAGRRVPEPTTVSPGASAAPD